MVVMRVGPCGHSKSMGWLGWTLLVSFCRMVYLPSEEIGGASGVMSGDKFTWGDGPLLSIFLLHLI